MNINRMNSNIVFESADHYKSKRGNTGDYSISHNSTGHFSIADGPFFMFDKPCTRQEYYATKPEWLKFALAKWIRENNMSDEEKEANPSYKTTGGYVKVYDYQKTARKSWNKATRKDQKATLKLPNYDDSIMQKIFGFSPEDELRKIENKPLSIEERLTKLEKAINETR